MKILLFIIIISFLPIKTIGLVTIAEHCPGQVGIVVYKARGLYDVITNQIHNYLDNCAGTGSGNRSINSNNAVEEKSAESNLDKSITNNFSLFPNPNNGNFIIKADGDIKQSLNIVVLDLSGKLVLTQQCETANSSCEIDAKQLKKGFYLVKINGTKTLKLFIE